MNILIPHSWLKDYLETKAKPKQIAEALSLHSASVESLKRVGNDWVYNIEITTNRIDMASVVGIAREAAALPRPSLKAKLKSWNVEHGTWNLANIERNYLKVKISKPSLCPRFSTLLLRVEEKPSPSWIQERLKMAGLRSVNNIVDATNYVMTEIGQPMHSFDFDKIKEVKSKNEKVKTITLRESQKGERITTLDGVTRELSGGDIVIEDGAGRLIDLCGLMGGKNTAIDKKTKTVLLFAQTYDPLKIRKTIQTTGLRTEAASRFEKGTDPELVLSALKRAYELLQKIANAKLIGGLIDIYPKPYQAKIINLDLNLVERYLGIKIPSKEIITILASLGFKLSNQLATSRHQIPVIVPSFRINDINLQEDLIEEIARIYGYHKLPSRLKIGTPVKRDSKQFSWIDKTKDALKYWSFSEVYTSSLVSGKLLKETGFNPKKSLKLKNPLGKEGEYLRPSLLPGILAVIRENQSRVGERVKIFELSKVYLSPHRSDAIYGIQNNQSVINHTTTNNPIQEPLMLSGAVIGANFLKLKGVVEGLFHALGIKDYQISPQVDQSCPIVKLLHPYRRAQITINASMHRSSEACGLIGQINNITIFDLDFETLVKHASTSKTYQPIPVYPPIIEDLSFIFPQKTYVGPVMEEIRKTGKLVPQVELLDSYQETRTFRIYYQDPKRNLTDKEIKTIRKKIIQIIEQKFKAKVKTG